MEKRKDWDAFARRELKRILEAANRVRGLHKPPRSAKASVWSVDLRLIGTRAMVRLNSQYRGKGHATDVLSFPSPEVFRSHGYLGDLVICTPTALRQARELGHRPEWEIRVLLAHGLLHLLGFDHETGDRDARAMARKERALLDAVASSRAARPRAKKRTSRPGLIDRAS